MSENRHENLKILAFVGLLGAGKSTAIEYLNSKGYPNVLPGEVVSQIHHLATAGQHRIITDAITDIDMYQTIKHEFPGQVTVVAITAEKHIRHHRAKSMNETQTSQEDWQEVAQGVESDLIALADYYIENDESRETFFANIDKLIEEIDFTL